MARRHRTKQREIAADVPTPAAAPKSLPVGDLFRRILLAMAAAILVARPLVPSDNGPWIGDGQMAAALWISLAGLWVVNSLAQPRLRIRFSWIDAALVALCGWWTIAAIRGAQVAAPRPSINMLWEGVATLVMFLLLRQLVDYVAPAAGRQSGGDDDATEVNRATPKDDAGEDACTTNREGRAFAAVMIAVGVILAITAMYQYFVKLPAYRQLFAENPAAMFREAQVPYSPPGTPEFQRFADRLNSPEPMATFDLTNSLAAFLAPWLVVVVGCITSWHAALSGNQSQQRKQGPGRFLTLRFAVCAALIAIALAMTRSRSAWIGAGVGLVCIAVWRYWRRRRIFFAVLAAAAVIVVTIAMARPRILAPAARSFQVRIDYWRATSRMIADHPWLGIGPGNYGDYYTQYRLPTAWEEIRDPHNFALEIAAGAGLPALGLFLAAMIGFAIRLWRPSKQGSSSLDPSAQNATQNAEPHAHAEPLTWHPRTDGNAKPWASDPRNDGTMWIFGGALVGFWLAMAWNGIFDFPALPEVAILEMVGAASVWWLIWPWVERGRLSPRLCGLGVLVLLVALLAIGGINYGGVNETLWLLVALGMNPTSRRRWPMHWFGQIALFALAACLWWSQHRTGYEPVLGCESSLESARSFAAEGDVQNQEHQLRLATEADPYAVEPLREMAGLRVGQWLQEQGLKQGKGHATERLLGEFEDWTNRAIRVDPRSAPLRAEAAEAWRQVFFATRLPADGQKAIDFFRQAAELDPNGVVVQFELAQTLAEVAASAGKVNQADLAAAKSAAREALRLDDLRPETDRGLSPEQREVAERIISGDNPAAALSKTRSQPAPRQKPSAKSQ